MTFQAIWASRELFYLGFLFTVKLTLLTVLTGTLLGLVISIWRRANNPLLRFVLRVYLEIFRGSPLLIQILFIYFGGLYLHVAQLSVFAAVTIAITLYQSAYIAEIFRAGFESVGAGQLEAAKSLSLSRFATFKDVVFPQAMNVSVAPLFGQYIVLVKNTSLASVIGYADLVRQGQGVIDRVGAPFAVFMIIAVLYFIISYPFSRIALRLERRSRLA